MVSRLATSISDQLTALADRLNKSVNTIQNSGITKPSPTLYGKIEQANKWFANPFLDDHGLGIQ